MTRFKSTDAHNKGGFISIMEITKEAIEQRTTDLINLWDKLYKVCNLTVDKCVSGEQTINGSTLRELNTFLKESHSILNKLKELVDAKNYLPDDDDLDIGDVPFPVKEGKDRVSSTAKQNEPLKIDFDNQVPFPVDKVK